MRKSLVPRDKNEWAGKQHVFSVTFNFGVIALYYKNTILHFLMPHCVSVLFRLFSSCSALCLCLSVYPGSVYVSLLYVLCPLLSVFISVEPIHRCSLCRRGSHSQIHLVPIFFLSPSISCSHLPLLFYSLVFNLSASLSPALPSVSHCTLPGGDCTSPWSLPAHSFRWSDSGASSKCWITNVKMLY